MARCFERPIMGTSVTATFPDRCISCGGARETEGVLTLDPPPPTSPSRRRARPPGRLTLRVPLCARCQRADQVVFLVSLGAYAIGALAIGIIVFVALFILDVRLLGLFVGQTTVNGDDPLLVLVALAAIAGLLGGFLVEALTKLLLWPVMGRSLANAPFWFSQVFGNTDHVAGVTAKVTADGQRVWLRLTNDVVARDFARLNE